MNSVFGMFMETKLLRVSCKVVYLYKADKSRLNSCPITAFCYQLSDSARSRLSTLRGRWVPKCYTFVSEYDEEATNLPYWMKSIGSKKMTPQRETTETLL